MVLEYGLQLVDSKYQILDCGSQKLPDSTFFPGFWISNAVTLKSKDEYICHTFLDSRSKHFLLAELIDRSSRFSSEKLCVPLELIWFVIFAGSCFPLHLISAAGINITLKCLALSNTIAKVALNIRVSS